MRVVLAWALAILLFSAGALGADLGPLRALPVLDGGRVKPLDTAARECVRLMTGREKFDSWDDPLSLCIAVMNDPVAWENHWLIHVPFLELRSILQLGQRVQYASPQQVRSNAKLKEILVAAQAKQRAAQHRGEEAGLTRLEAAALEVQQRLDEYDLLVTDRRFAIAPGKNAEAWLTAADAGGVVREDWRAVVGSYGSAASLAKLKADLGATPELPRLDWEVSYNHLRPFRWAWVTYLCALGVLCTSLMVRAKVVYRAGMTLLLVGIAWSAFSFAWRCSITGWAPVTNIYETVIWVATVGSVVAAGIELFNGTKIPAIAGALAATVAGVVADVMPPEFGGTFRTLAPVLQTNLWLTIHVLTIVSSYAAFLVALVLGNIVLGQFAFRPGHPGVSLNLKHLYRAVQIGVLLVGAGTILGGLWADVSWGRFWGWDPKEVWALIIFLVYLALLHGRYAGWVKPFGLAAGAVVCFLAVLMSWYGVNFILGAGQHTYGFATGGFAYVAGFTVAQLAYLAVCTVAHQRRHAASGPAFPVVSSVS